MSKPLLISDCDGVLLHMMNVFQQWLNEEKAIDFDLGSGDFATALRYQKDGSVIDVSKISDLLGSFFDTEMHRQQPIDGAVEGINRIAEFADVVILTNLMHDRNQDRVVQLRNVGIDFPVYTNQGGKGEAMQKILDKYAPSAAVFIDDLGHQHESIAEHTPHVWRLHFVGELIMREHLKTSRHAHERIDEWAGAEHWIREKLLNGEDAPPLEKETA